MKQLHENELKLANGDFSKQYWGRFTGKVTNFFKKFINEDIDDSIDSNNTR